MNKTRLYKLLVSTLYFSNVIGISLFWFLAIARHQHLTTTNMILSIGHLSGLLAVIFVLVELLMMARVPLIEKAYSLDELTRIHRINGYLAFGLMSLHVIATTIAYQLINRSSFIGEYFHLITTFEDVLKGSLGFILFIIVTFTSIRAARKRVSYEVWYFIHLGAYLAVVLAFGHQINVGPDFIGRPAFVVYWYMLYAATALLIAWYRFVIPALSMWRYQLKVIEIKPETHDSYTLKLAGPGLSKFTYEPGQFAIWYVLSKGIWWQGHPFSISSNVGDNTLDVTIKASGDYTKILPRAKVGSSVIVDGPHGKFTLSKTTNKKLLMIAGGVGITPIYSMLKNMDFGDYDVELLYACRSTNDIIFDAELNALSTKGLKRLCYLSEEPGQAKSTINNDVLRGISDLHERDVFLCGPPAMMAALTSNLVALKVPKKQIHSERFDY